MRSFLGVKMGKINIDMFVWSAGLQSAGDGDHKDRSQVKIVGRTIVGRQRRSERPKSGNGDRKDRSQRATEVEKIVVSDSQKDYSRCMGGSPTGHSW
ncbi:hypothetical protein MA16_Dca016314 [Dendrobium catenatum]|uniref:Uncharacterized protein n=1 Tax=Dendrobium catenatum TaxID=906689 RepID=A0A2I0W889_9ASPA|nr:hypothetical protein MA16_Dca016314 [Dendrobium catenatum]